MDAYNQRMSFKTEQEQRSIYTTALLTAKFIWSKRRIPSYEEVFTSREKAADMTPEEMLRQVEFLNAMFGGDDTRNEVE